MQRLTGGGAPRGTSSRAASAYPEYDHPGRFAATDPDDDDAFLSQVRARAEAQRRAETARRREREQAEITAREQRHQDRHGLPQDADDADPQEPGTG